MQDTRKKLQIAPVSFVKSLKECMRKAVCSTRDSVSRHLQLFNSAPCKKFAGCKRSQNSVEDAFWTRGSFCLTLKLAQEFDPHAMLICRHVVDELKWVREAHI